MARRLAALLLALLVAGATVSPCAAGAIARADRAAADHASGAAPCHGPSTAIDAPCPCGCSGDAPRGAPSPSSAPWALAAPTPGRVEPGRSALPPDRSERPTSPAPSGIEHVPIASPRP